MDACMQEKHGTHSRMMTMSRSSVLGLKALEGRNLDVLDKRVELLLGILILVLLSADSHTDLSGHVSNARAP